MKVLLVVVAVLVVIWLCQAAFFKYIDHFSPKSRSRDHEPKVDAKDDHDHKAAAKSGGHDDHDHPEEKKDGWGLLKFSIGLLGLVVVACVGSWAIGYMGGFSTPQTRGQALAQASAMGTRNETSLGTAPAASRPVQTEWLYYDAPTRDDWHTITALPGWTIETCSVVTDPNCTDTEPHGYRMKCINSAGLDRDWTTGECSWLNSLSVQSTGDKPLRMKWRDKKKLP